MNISNHAYERYCKRFLGIEDCKEIKKYVTEHKDEIYKAVNEIFEDSIFIYHGKLGTEDIAKFYLKKQIVIVINDAGDCIKTLYKIDFGFPEEINQNVIDGLTKVIFDLRVKLDTEITNKWNAVSDKEKQIDLINLDIKATEERLRYLNGQKSVINQEINVIKQSTRELETQITKHAYQLCNSLDYRKELLKLVK